MTDLTKDEVVKMAEQSAIYAAQQTNDRYEQEIIRIERFANLCRADLVAEVERLTAYNATRTDELAASVRQCAELKQKMFDESAAMVGIVQVKYPQALAENERLQREEQESQLHLERATRSRDDWKARALAASEREGWKWVPVEPTQLMRDAGNKTIDMLKTEPGMGIADRAFYTYRAMLAASPQEQQ